MKRRIDPVEGLSYWFLVRVGDPIWMIWRQRTMQEIAWSMGDVARNTMWKWEHV